MGKKHFKYLYKEFFNTEGFTGDGWKIGPLTDPFSLISSNRFCLQKILHRSRDVI